MAIRFRALPCASWTDRHGRDMAGVASPDEKRTWKISCTHEEHRHSDVRWETWDEAAAAYLAALADGSVQLRTCFLKGS